MVLVLLPKQKNELKKKAFSLLTPCLRVKNHLCELCVFALKTPHPPIMLNHLLIDVEGTMFPACRSVILQYFGNRNF